MCKNENYYVKRKVTTTYTCLSKVYRVYEYILDNMEYWASHPVIDSEDEVVARIKGPFKIFPQKLYSNKVRGEHL
jgi:hypothetical protein